MQEEKRKSGKSPRMYVQVGVFEFPIISPQPERHLEHQTTFSPVKMHVLCVDVLSDGFLDFLMF